MMQETGNNKILTKAVSKESIGSIQLSPDGLFFCVRNRLGEVIHLAEKRVRQGSTYEATLKELCQSEPLSQVEFRKVIVVVDTDRAVLVPQELFDPQRVESLLGANDITLLPGESCVTSGDLSGMVACMPCSEAIVALLKEQYTGADLEFLHPLQVNALKPIAQPRIEFNLSQSFVHVTVREKRLLWAETLPYATYADLLFMIEQLHRTFSFLKHECVLSGWRADQMKKEIRPYYKSVRLGNLPGKLKKGSFFQYNNVIDPGI